MGDATSERSEYWESLYRRRKPSEVSWYQEEPAVSLDLLNALGVSTDQPVVDVGGGASLLVVRLIELGFRDVSVLDLSTTALGHARERLGEDAHLVHWIDQDVLTWRPSRRYGAWHDRAVFHFLVEADQRRAYIATMSAALVPQARVVIGTFAADGPQQCSGLSVQGYSPQDLSAVFGAEFQVAEHRREEHHTPSGRVQPFTWTGLVYRPSVAAGSLQPHAPQGL